MSNANVNQNGMLVSLNVKVWGNRTKAKAGEFETDIPEEYFSAVKRLIPRKHIKPLEKIRNAARTYIYSKSYPFPIRGVTFTSFEMIQSMDDQLKAYQVDFYRELDLLIDKYSDALIKAEEKLGKHMDRSKYPSPEVLRSKFSFDWSIYDCPVNNSLKKVSIEIYNRQKAKIESEMAEAGQTMLTVLTQRYVEMLQRITEKMVKEKKRFKRTAFENFDEFLADFPKMSSVSNDAELKKELDSLAKKTKKLLKNVDLNEMKTDDKYRQELGKEFGKVEKAALGMLESIPKRSIKIKKK